MENRSSGGIGTLGVIQIVFIILKCIGVINWPWKIVLIPLWIDLSLAVIIIIIYLIASHTSNNKEVDDFFNYK